MAKVTFDVTDLDPDEGGNFYAGPDPVRGAYSGKVANSELTQSKGGKDMIKYRVEITSGKYKGWAGFDNITLEPSTKFKLNQLISATKPKVGRKGTVDALIKWLNDNHPAIGIFVQNGTDQNGHPRAEVGRVFPSDNLKTVDEDEGVDESEDTEEVEDAEEPDEEEVDEAESDEEEVDEAESDEEDEEEDSETYSAEELSELTDQDLADLADEYEVSYKKSGKTGKLLKRADVEAAILEAQGGESEEDEDEPEEDGFSEEELNAMGLGELKQAATDAGVYRKGMKKPAMVKAILESQDDDESAPPF